MANFEIDFLESYDRDSIVEELRRIVSVTGKSTVTKSDIKIYGRCSHDTVIRRFGSLRKALEAAGLISQRYMKATDDELLSMFIELWERTLKDEGRRPSKTDLKKYRFPVSSDTYTRRFGSWKKTLLAAYNSVAVNESDSENQEINASIPDIPENTRKPARKSLSVRKRFFVMKRDHFACVKCGAAGYGVKLEVDHITPFSKGGSDALDNLQTLCFSCNHGKRNDLE